MWTAVSWLTSVSSRSSSYYNKKASLFGEAFFVVIRIIRRLKSLMILRRESLFSFALIFNQKVIDYLIKNLRLLHVAHVAAIVDILVAAIF